MGADEEGIPEKKRKSLLEKYDIPISHLDFSYVKECTDILELERIIKILRSNEEGSYPELLHSFEERLTLLNPENKILRVTEPVMTKSQLKPDQWKSLQDDITNWKEEFDSIDNKLSLSKDQPEFAYPAVRKVLKSLPEKSKHEANKEKPRNLCSTDYGKWDTFDADSECLKLDLAEEKAKEEKQRLEQEKKRKMEVEVQLTPEEKASLSIAEMADSLTLEEKKIIAMKEKDLGNEFYQTNHLDKSLYYYTRSICLHPTAASYNNRAATYLKQCRFSKALDDLNIVLQMEPGNVKAHFRRATAYQHRNEFYKALEDILEVLRQEPRHVLARHVADQLRENCASLPKKHRVKVRDDDNPSQLVVKELTEDELRRDYKDKDYVEITDVGLPKIMCNCNGKYTNDPAMKSNDPLRFQHLRDKFPDKVYDKHTEASRVCLSGKRVKPMSVKFPDDTMMSGMVGKRNKSVIEAGTPNQISGVLYGGSKRLEIIEMEKIEEEEHSPNKQIIVSDSKEKSDNQQIVQAAAIPVPCRVTDMRENKMKKVYFGGYTEENTELPECSNNNNDSDPVPYTHNSGNTSDEENGQLRMKKLEFLETFGTPMNLNSTSNLNQSDRVNMNMPPLKLQVIDQGFGSQFRTAKNSSPSSLCNSPLNELSSDLDSDDEFQDDENSSDCIVNINQAEKVIDNDVDTISKDLFPDENLPKCECGEGYRLKPCQFQTKWEGLSESAMPVEERGKLIRLVCPHNISTVIGSTLNEELLLGFFTCLDQHFDIETEKEKVVNYVKAISGVQRFSIINSFLSKEDKQTVSKLFHDLILKFNSVEESKKNANIGT